MNEENVEEVEENPISSSAWLLFGAFMYGTEEQISKCQNMLFETLRESREDWVILLKRQRYCF